ncbi:hypothetical protein [Thiothrix lacustris]|uniref:hypothetical protein n=1 Tax=Thiothrix lacustris TaxID=525917 RepID=UPI0027E48208|nr:hypothetical protein [Thiothrix lacustris]WMP16729.1 hypothetical protein RCS87_15285 [Thiothrix lacustris]
MTNLTNDLSSLNASLLANHQTQYLTEATQRVFGDTARLRQLAIDKQNVLADKAQGWMFEQLEVTKFNTDAVYKGSRLYAATTDSLGQTNHQTTDVVVKQGKQILKEFQLKSSNEASSSAFRLADKKYADVNLVAPSNQTDEVQRFYAKKEGFDYTSASKRLHKGVEADNVSSGGTTYDEALKATDAKHANRVANTFETKAALSDMHQSGMEAAKMGAAFGGISSGVSGLYLLSQGKATKGEVAAQVIVDTSKSFATNYLTTAGSKGIVHGLAKAGVSQTTVDVLTKSNAHVALAAGIVKSGQSVVRYLRGEIDSDQLMGEISETAITGASTFYYGALGQAIIPIPIVGAMIGSTIGYFVGSMLHQSGLIGLGEVAVVKVARERRERIEAMCLESIPLIRQHRLELEALLKTHFAERRQLLTQAFDGMEQSLVSWDADDFTRHLESVNQAFGKSLPFKSFNEFDAFMKDKDSVFVL